jgi:hypothetical protein
VIVAFPEAVDLAEVRIMFQGGFVGQVTGCQPSMCAIARACACACVRVREQSPLR